MTELHDQGVEAFRIEARTWIDANFPTELRGAPSPMLGEVRKVLTAAQSAWVKAMGEKGWSTPTWPAAYGGGGLSAAEARALQQELDEAGAYNPIGGMGVMLLGPTLLEYGTEVQKREHIPPIVRGETWWCQGYSEPGAGSDLAALQTRAEDQGDHFLVNGQKVWTSGAQYADWCFCLVRTDTTRKQGGISFVLIDMHQAGVEVRPIALIDGSAVFCEVFFHDAVALKKDLVGQLNGGWAIAKRLLQFERSEISDGALFVIGPAPADLAKTYVGLDAMGRIADADLRARIIQNDIDWQAYQQTVARVGAEAGNEGGPSAATSILKNVITATLQARAELVLEIMGYQGLGWEGEGFSDDEKAAVRVWLGEKATSIYGGSQEIQANIIAKRILGLPDALPIR
ncbi:MAG: acyl-CoA dehydrogenase [Bradyrhizobium sp.]|nr:acyl-CoA dehydrogenase [Bradyrhizobium sp.]